METLESGFIENKGVPACKQIGASQFPIGDDVSALHPLRSSVEVLALENPPWTEEDGTTNRPRGTSMSKAEATTRAGNQATATHDHQFQGRCVERDLDCSSTIPSWAYQYFSVLD